MAFPKYTNEGIGYMLECWPCRLEGKAAKYIGESSRSAFQRGKEHVADIRSGKKTHPLNIHFNEAHDGLEQEVIMRTLTTPQTALARQVWESVTIDIMSARKPESCLNLKSEWGQSRTPALVNKERPAGRKPERMKDGRGRAREGTAGKGMDQEGNVVEEGRPGKRRKVEGSEEDPVEKEEVEPEVRGGDEDVKAGCFVSLASTPVHVKVARLQKRIQAEKEGEEGKRVSKEEGKEGPMRKREKKQPTLSSF